MSLSPSLPRPAPPSAISSTLSTPPRLRKRPGWRARGSTLTLEGGRAFTSGVAHRLRICFSQTVGHSCSAHCSFFTTHCLPPLFPHISTAVTNPLLPLQLPQTSRLPF